ncbi:hypothetical protein ACTMM5_16240, partial [Escherichia coli]
MAGDLRRLRGDRDKKSVPHCIVHAGMNGLFFLTTELHRSFSSYITFTSLLQHFYNTFASLLHHSFSSYVTFTSVPSSVPFVHHPLPERADSGFSGCAGKVSQLRNKLPARSPFQVRRKILFFGVGFEFRLKPDAWQSAA